MAGLVNITEDELLRRMERAKGAIEYGVEMVGPEPYEFTKDEVISIAYDAIDAWFALHLMQEGRQAN